jgi:predicted NodU family carbamoyl transferase
VADALRRRAPKRLAVQAYVEGNLLHEDLAFAVQELLEDTALHVARTLRQRPAAATCVWLAGWR